MIYHQITSHNPLEIFLNLEELIVLSALTDQECKVKVNENARKYFDIPFETIELFPDNLISFDISDYVCMYHEDLIDLYGAEFLSYRKNQNTIYTRLNKFALNDFLISFSKPNYYETKYFLSNKNTYKEAKHKAIIFDFKKSFLDSYKHLSHILPFQPLLCLSDQELNKDLPFDSFFYTYSSEKDLNQEFFAKKNYNALNLNEYLVNYHESHKDVDINALICSVSECFSDLYGFPNDLLFGVLSKYIYRHNSDWEPNLLDFHQGGLLDKYHLKNVSPNSSFHFSQKNLNIERSKLMSLIRFRDCCVNN